MDVGAGCPVDILIDLSEPAPTETVSKQEDKENLLPVADLLSDCKEITRRDSLSECKTDDVDDALKQEVVVKDKSLPPQNSLSLSDVRLIDEEVFDFDLPASPEKLGEGSNEPANKGEDEEVFIGPVGFTEKCIAVGVAEEAVQPLSPLRPEQMAELAMEAYSVAFRISNMNSGSTSEDSSPIKSTPSMSCQRRLASLFRDGAGDSQASLTRSNKTAENNANVSPKKRRRSETYTKESDSDKVSNSTEKKHKKKGTFTKEEPVENLASLRTTRSGGKEKKAATEGTGIPQRGGQGTSKLQPPSKLRRYNNSQPNLSKPKVRAAEAVGSEHKVGDGTVPSVARRSLQLPKAWHEQGGGGDHNQKQGRGGGDTNTDSSLPNVSTARPSLRRAHSLNFKSGLPAAPRSKLALPSHTSSAAASGQSAAQKSADRDVSTSAGSKSRGIPKGPVTKPQLMHPRQLQRKSFAVAQNKNTTSSQRGPLKAPSESRPKMGDTVERPYNPALAAAAAGNSQCPATPAVHKTVPPKTLSMSSDASTPANSSCSSTSLCGSTPGSVKNRLSMLPTPSKRRSVNSSLPPPSPMSMGSTSSSVSKHSLASSSDACDSPVFDPKTAARVAKNRRVSGASKGSCTSSDLDRPGMSPSAFKPRKPLVQNTPELPKRTLSRWSPLRKPKPVPLEEQVSMCTKRVTPN